MLFDHLSRHRLRHQKNAFLVDIDHFFECSFVEFILPGRRFLIDQQTRKIDPGVVNQTVDATKTLDNFCYRMIYLFGAGNIGRPELITFMAFILTIATVNIDHLYIRALC